MDLSHQTIDEHPLDDDRYECSYQVVDQTNEVVVEDDSSLTEDGADDSNDIIIPNILSEGDLDTLTGTLTRDTLVKLSSDVHENILFNKQESTEARKRQSGNADYNRRRREESERRRSERSTLDTPAPTRRVSTRARS